MSSSRDPNYWHDDTTTRRSRSNGSLSTLAEEQGELAATAAECRPATSVSGIAPLDITTMKRIYEKALLASKLEEEARPNSIDAFLRDCETYAADDRQAAASRADECRKLRQELAGLCSGIKSVWDETKEQQQQEQEPDDDKVEPATSPSEIHVLRQYYERARDESSRLRLLLNVREEELNHIRDKYKAQEKALEQTSEELGECHKTVAQLERANLQLKTRCNLLEEEMKTLKEDSKYCQDGRNRLAKEVLRLEKDFNLEREARAKLETTLHQVIQEKQRDILFLEENWKSLHGVEVGRLNRTIADLNHKLTKEEDVRRCIQQGLNSLQHCVPSPNDNFRIVDGTLGK